MEWRMVFRKQLGTVLPLIAISYPNISFLLLDWLSEANLPDAFSLGQDRKSDGKSRT